MSKKDCAREWMREIAPLEYWRLYHGTWVVESSPVKKSVEPLVIVIDESVPYDCADWERDMEVFRRRKGHGLE